jgi:pSer/pThr/pTyr-binding forkhead associated (FHA) protein
MSEVVFIEETPMEGHRRPAAPGPTSGRAGCDVELSDPNVSRRHAMIHGVDNRLGIEDLGTTNGTFVNETRITGIVPITPGARVRFGNTVWCLAAVDAPETVA